MRDLHSPNDGISTPELRHEPEYYPVVVIGNGPSGIALSALLSGYWPYYTGQDHADDMLSARLHTAQNEDPGSSIVEQDLQFLADGLEGRSSNPVAVLLDQLTHPCADLGVELPSLLEWRHQPHRFVEHVVLGKGPPGGAWQAMDGNVLTISLANWMELPGLEFRQWEANQRHHNHHHHHHFHHHSNHVHHIHSHHHYHGVIDSELQTSPATNASPTRESRASVAQVARYYADYVHSKGLARHFRNGTQVTAVRPLEQNKSSTHRWLVDGFDSETGQTFQYICQHVVLATGATDSPNRLHVEGESSHPEWVVHRLGDLESALDTLPKDCDPILIVGAGLSAADAIITSRFHSFPIVHVFRSASSTLDKQLPENMYPEYHKVHQMMCDGGASYPFYRSLPQHKVVSLNDHKVQLEGPDGKKITERVSLAAVLIGSRPDLAFVPYNLATRPESPIDPKNNPVLVDPYTYRALNSPHPGLYAMGPLAGDNFVRFILGAAIAITGDIQRQRI